MARKKRDEAYARALGTRIRTARRDAKLNQEDIAKACGVSTTAVHNWEVGDSPAPALDVVTIARITGCDLEWLATGKPRAGFGSVRGATEGTAVVRVAWKDLDDLDSARKKSTRLVMSKRPVGPDAFSLVVHDGANTPKLQVGDDCIFDPDKKPEPEKFVLAFVGKNRTPVIRIYNERSDHILLVPCNAAHKEYVIKSPKDGEVIATLVEFSRPM